MQTHLTGSNFFLTHPPNPQKWRERERKSNLIVNIIDLSFLFSDIYTPQGYFNYIGAFGLLPSSASHQDRPPAAEVMDTRKRVRITALIPIHTFISTYGFVHELTQPSRYSCLSFLFFIFFRKLLKNAKCMHD